jgi:hypothetical protein
MRNHFAISLVLITAVSGCAASIPPVEVTRFNIGQAVPPGGYVVQPLPGSDAKSLEYQTYAAAVSRELDRLQFNSATPPAYTALVEFTRTSRALAPTRPPVTIGIGGGTFGGGVGIGLGTSFGVGHGKNRENVASRLAVRLVRKVDGTVVWEGRAVTEALSSAPAAQPGLAADKLAAALFKTFPGDSGKTVIVP